MTAQTAQQNPAPAPPATQNSAAQIPRRRSKNRLPSPPPSSSTAKSEDNYLPESVTVGTLDGAPLRETPLSATVVTRDLLNDQVSRLLSDVVKNDASVGDDYVPVGYYGDYQIRGFPLDLATGLEVNGMTIAGEQDVPLENKEQVEFLKGIAAVESGVASAGGLIDYVTKRPANIKAVDLATDHRGSAYRRRRSRPSLRQPQAGGRAPESRRRAHRSLHERHQRLARHGRRRGRLEDRPGHHAQRRLRVPAQDRARRQRLSTARRHNPARHQPHLSLHHARRSALGSRRHLRHLQHRRAPRAHLLAVVGRLCRRQLQPLAHSGQRDLRLRLLLRNRVLAILGGSAPYHSSLLPTAPTTSTTTATPASCASMPRPKPC